MGERGRRWTAGALVLLVAGALGGCDLETERTSVLRGPEPAPTTDPDSGYDPSEDDELALQVLMEARAQAVKKDDVDAFLATVDQRPELLADQETLFHNMAALPIAALQYDVSTRYLLPAPVPGGDPVLHPQVVEHLVLTGTTQKPLSNRLDLTFVRRGEDWLVGAEREPGAKGSVEEPQERPWFGVPISVHHRGKLTVLVDADSRQQLDGLVATIGDGVRRDAEILGIRPNDRVLVDATSNGLSEEFGLGVSETVGAVTFALYTDDLVTRELDVVGVAIKVNPERVDELIDNDQLLWHELTHYLLFRQGFGNPAWLVEGVAAWVEYQPARLSGLVVPDELYDRAQAATHELPIDGLFYGEPDLNYLIGQATVQWLVDRDGTDKLFALMRAYKRLGRRGTPDTNTGKALRQVYGLSEREVADGAWETLSTLHH